MLKRINAKDKKVFFLYSAYVAISIVLLFFINSLTELEKARLFIQKFFLVIESLFLSYYYFIKLKSKFKIYFLPIPTIILLVAFFIESIKFSSDLPFLLISVQVFFYSVVIILFFFESLKFITSTPIYMVDSFWISIAFLLSFSGTFFLNLFSISVGEKNQDFIVQYNFVYGGFTVLKNILLSIGVILFPKIPSRQDDLTDIDFGFKSDEKQLMIP